MLFPKLDFLSWGLVATLGKNSHKGTTVTTAMLGSNAHFWEELAQQLFCGQLSALEILYILASRN